MSQITRCPSCATSFKVVADQLRISEGWVRCGQCKEVFDAAAHLLPAPPPALLPDVSLTDVRPPPLPVPRKPDTGRIWGESAVTSSRSSAPAKAGPAPAAPLYAAEDFSLLASQASRTPDTEAAAGTAAAPTGPAVPGMPEGSDGFEVQLGSLRAASDEQLVLDVPDPAVPAFLAAGGPREHSLEDLQLEPLTPFAWRAREGLSSPAGPGTAERGATLQRSGSALPDPLLRPASADEAAVAAVRDFGPGTGEAAHVPAGYELPFAELRDEEDPLSGTPSFESTVPADLTPMGYPALELPVKPAAFAPDAKPAVLPFPASEDRSPPPVQSEKAESTAEPLPPVDFVEHSSAADRAGAEKPMGLSRVDDEAPSAALQTPSRKVRADDAQEDEPASPEHDEVSFVVAARRKAFWRRPAVRGVLAVGLLAAALALAVQVAVQERDRIAAMDARTRPWLMHICALFQCEIAPRRQIADVVIDSSSFNKARGDSYQLTLAMKNKADMPVAMPAVELTLTDAQDQAVLRRVLLPIDMGAPAELSARGEWSTSVSVVVTTGGARVAGYRLLAFYP